MEFKDKIEILFKEIQDIKNFVEIIKNNDQISQIESDILKSRIQGLYITLLELGKKESGSESISMEKDVSEFEKNYKVIEDLKPEPEQAEETFSDDMTFIEEIESLEIEEPTEVQVEEDESIEEIKEEDKVDEKQEPVSEPVTGQDDDGLIKNEKLEMENKVEDRIKQKSKEVVSDLYKNKQKYRNESLQKERVSSDISSKFHNNPITDIASSIGINDKFRYVRELFDGDSSKYSSTIEVLNQVGSEVDAVNYLKDNFSWDMEDKLVSRLLELTRRKLKIKGDD